MTFSDGEFDEVLIDVTFSDPTMVSPSIGNSPLCNAYVGPGGDWQTIVINCTSPAPEGQYVTIQIVHAHEDLSLCEVKVYGQEGKCIVHAT